MKLDGKTALVTGGAVRIGRAICRGLANSGCHVVVHYHRSGEEAENLVEALRVGGVSAWAVRGDLSTEQGCVTILDAAWKAADGIDILVNNASVFQKHEFSEIRREVLLDQLCVNAFAPITLVRRFVELAGEKDAPEGPSGRGDFVRGDIRGKVVNLVDRRVETNDPDCIPYLLSKKMLTEFTRAAALALAPEITVNAVAPGAVLPPSGLEGEDEESLERMRELAGPIPLDRRSTPEDVVSAVLYLLESDVVTGQVLFVDGGQHLLGGSKPGSVES